MKAKKCSIGWASIDITPDRPVFVAGQMYPRISTVVLEPLTATAVVFEQEGEQFTLLSADVVNFNVDVIRRVRDKLAGVQGLDPMRVAFCATHTHNSMRCAQDPHLVNSRRFLGEDRGIPWNPPENILYGDEEAEFVAARLAVAIEEAWVSRRPGGIAFADDYAAVGFNRRPIFRGEDGGERSRMHGVCSQPSFLRFEAASDHLVAMFYTFDDSGALTGVGVNVNCPSQVFELHTFLTSDFWADARACIRERLGNIRILPMCGAAGDQDPSDLMRLGKYNEEAFQRWGGQTGEVLRNFDMSRECRKIGERISEAVCRGYGFARNHVLRQLDFRVERLDLSLPIRKVSREDVREAQKLMDQASEAFPAGRPITMEQYLQIYEPMGVLLRWERQNQNPDFEFEVFVARLANAVFATNPFELFSEYGIRIRARSAADYTFIVQLCNGAGGYLPTTAALSGGSYSSKPATTTLGPDGGDRLVEETLGAIGKMYQP